MLLQKTTLRLALCLAVGLSAAACSDDDPGGEGGGTTSSTSSATTGSGGGTTSTSSATTGQGGANEGGANEGGANEGGANEGGANEGGGSGEGGANEGGGSGEGGSTPTDPACGADTATFADVQAILTASCAGCHGNSDHLPGELDLRANAAHDGLVSADSTTCADRVLVVPGMPSQSYLINKLRNVDLCNGGKRMPPPPNMALSEANIKKISDWICAGAPSD
ncbi:PE-PGRS family protein [Sorangium sp. So ce385]|uniref:PE-PGRS family protein n=1 Tax=Sorangium sp. So ce385 TaxID=3133308 RepID=UPI003F5B9E7D